MSYKLLKITSFYPAFLDAYHKKNPNIKFESYKTQFLSIMTQGFALADFYARNLEKLGVKADEIICNDSYLQNAWAKEYARKGLSYDDILLEQIKYYQPDVLFLQGRITKGNSLIKNIKKIVKSIRIMICYWGVDYSYSDVSFFSAFDVILTCTPGLVNKFKKDEFNAYLLPHGFEHTLLAKIQNKNIKKEEDIIFLGLLIKSSGYHNSRRQLISDIIDNNINIKIHTPTQKETFLKTSIKQIAYTSANILKRLRLQKFYEDKEWFKKSSIWTKKPLYDTFIPKVKKYLHPPLYGIEMLKAIQESKLGLNIHIDSAGDYAGNMRLFEITGVGTCMVTDHKKNIKDLFEPDREIITFKSNEECVEKIKWLLDNPIECKKIGKAGQQKTLQKHTIKSRVQRLNEIILDYF